MATAPSSFVPTPLPTPSHVRAARLSSRRHALPRRPALWRAVMPEDKLENQHASEKGYKGGKIPQIFRVQDVDIFPLPNRSALGKEMARASRLRKRGNWRAARAVLEAIRPAAGKDAIFLTELVFTEGAELLELCPNIRPLEVFNQLRKLFDGVPANPTTSTYNAVLHSLQRMLPSTFSTDTEKETESKAIKPPSDVMHVDVIDVAARAIDHMAQMHLEPDQFTMSILFGMCGRAKALPYLKHFETLVQKHQSASGTISVNALVCAYCKCDDLEGAEHILQSVRTSGLPVKDRAYASLISAFNRRGRHRKVLQYLSEAIADEDVQPSEYMFTGAVSSCCKVGDSKNVQWTLEKMLEANIEPSENILNSIFLTALRSGDIQLGSTLLFNWISYHPSFEPTVQSFNKLISSGRKSQISVEQTCSAILNILDRMEGETGVKPEVSTYNAVSGTLIKLGQYKEAQRVIQVDMVERGLSPDIASFNSLIRSLGMSGQAQLALEVAQNLSDVGLNADQYTYNTLLEVLRMCDDVEVRCSIRTFLKQMEENGDAKMDMVSITSVLNRYRSEGSGKNALMLFANSLRTNNMFDAKAHGLLLTILFECEMEAEAISVFGWLLWKRAVQENVYNVMMHQIGKKPSGIPMMEKLFANMKERDVAPDEISYTTLIRRCAQHGLMDRSLRLVSEMQDVGLGMSDSFAWTAVIDGCGKGGLWERGVEVLKYMMEGSRGQSRLAPAPTSASYNAGLYAAGLHGKRWDIAKEIFLAMVADESVEPDAVTYSAMASIILRNRFDVKEVSLVQDVLKNLRKVIAGEFNSSGTGTGMRRQQRMSGSYRKESKLEVKKLTAKAHRLEWILKYKLEMSREGSKSRNEDTNKDSTD